MSAGLTFQIDGGAIARLGNRLAQVNTDLVITRALNHTGMKARTAMIRSLTAQTGLKRKVIVKALKVSKATHGFAAKGTAARHSFTITSRGGDISLKYFSPRETRSGVSAAPWGKRRVYAQTFLKGGRFPGRVTLSLGGHVFKRAGGKRLPIRVEKSDLYIPKEMVEGATAAAFQSAVAADLPARLEHEIGYALQTGGF